MPYFGQNIRLLSFYRFVSDPVSDPDSNPDNPDSNPDNPDNRFISDPDPAKSFGSLGIRIRRNTDTKAPYVK